MLDALLDIQDTLLHCPFCGGQAHFRKSTRNGGICLRAECNECRARVKSIMVPYDLSDDE